MLTITLSAVDDSGATVFSCDLREYGEFVGRYLAKWVGIDPVFVVSNEDLADFEVDHSFLEDDFEVEIRPVEFTIDVANMTTHLVGQDLHERVEGYRIHQYEQFFYVPLWIDEEWPEMSAQIAGLISDAVKFFQKAANANLGTVVVVR